jgi:hypothetical protein
MSLCVCFFFCVCVCVAINIIHLDLIFASFFFCSLFCYSSLSFDWLYILREEKIFWFPPPYPTRNRRWSRLSIFVRCAHVFYCQTDFVCDVVGNQDNIEKKKKKKKTTKRWANTKLIFIFSIYLSSLSQRLLTTTHTQQTKDRNKLTFLSLQNKK